MLFRLIISFIFSLSFCFALPSVTMVETSVKASLNGQSKELALKDEIAIESEIISDESGKAEIMFDDGSLVNIAASTQILLSDFVDSQESQNILVDMTTGTARFITGEINRKNPEAFKVDTPNATIGIRGTMVTISVNGDETSVYLHETSGLGVIVTNKATGKSMELKTPGQIIEIKAQNMQENKATQANSDKIIAVFSPRPQNLQNEQLQLNFGKVLTYPVFTASKSSNTALENPTLYTEQNTAIALNTTQNTLNTITQNTLNTQNTLANATEAKLSDEPEAPKSEPEIPKYEPKSEPEAPKSEPTTPSSEPTPEPPKKDDPIQDPTDPTTDPTNPQGDTPGQTSWIDNIAGVFRGSDDNALIGFSVSSKASISNAYFIAGNDFGRNGSGKIDDEGEFEIRNFQNSSGTLSGEFSENGTGGKFELTLASGDDVYGDFEKLDLKATDIKGTFADIKDTSSIEFSVNGNAKISEASFSIADATAMLEGFHGSGEISQDLSFAINGFKDENNLNDVDGNIAGVFHDAQQGIYQLKAGNAEASGIFYMQ